MTNKKGMLDLMQEFNMKMEKRLRKRRRKIKRMKQTIAK